MTDKFEAETEGKSGELLNNKSIRCMSGNKAGSGGMVGIESFDKAVREKSRMKIRMELRVAPETLGAVGEKT